MTETAKVLWTFAMSLDGFVAGPNHEMHWMTGFSVGQGVIDGYIAGTGAVLGGRAGWDATVGKHRPWGGAWAGQLTAGGDRPAEGFGDGLEGRAEHVVQDEGDPFGRGKPLQHNQKRQPDLVVERDAVGRVDGRRQLGHVAGQLAPGMRGLQLVQAQPAGHDGEPAPVVVHVHGGRPADKSLLHDVLGRADVAEHAVRQVHQVRAVGPPHLTEASHKGYDDTGRRNVTSLSGHVTFSKAASS